MYEMLGQSWGYACSRHGGKNDIEILDLNHHTICFATRCDGDLHSAAKNLRARTANSKLLAWRNGQHTTPKLPPRSPSNGAAFSIV
jgi:hypothetical protein